MKAPVQISLIVDNYLGFRWFDGQTSYDESPNEITTSQRRGRNVRRTARVAIIIISRNSAGAGRSPRKDQTDYWADVKRQY